MQRNVYGNRASSFCSTGVIPLQKKKTTELSEEPKGAIHAGGKQHWDKLLKIRSKMLSNLEGLSTTLNKPLLLAKIRDIWNIITSNN